MTTALACLWTLLAGASLAVDARSVVPDADGSPAKPFRAVSAALGAAKAGDVILLRTGLFTERVIVDKAVRIVGSKSAVIASPDERGTVVEVRAAARLEGLSVQGGEIGVEVKAPAYLKDVSFSAQRRAAVHVGKGVRAEIDGGVFSALFERADLVGLDSAGGEVVVHGARFEGPFRYAIRGQGGRLQASDVAVETPVDGIACLAGCRGHVRGAQVAQGRGIGILADASTLLVEDTLVSRFLHGIEGRDGAVLDVIDCATAFCEESAVVAKRARLRLRHHVHVGPASLAAVGLIDSDSIVEEGVIAMPGATGIAFHRGRGEVVGTVIRGARGADEGDALWAENTEDLVLRAPFLEASASTGMTVQGGHVRGLGVEVSGATVSGVIAANRATVELEGPAVRQSDGAGLAAREGARIKASFGRFEELVAGPAFSSCADGAAVELWRTMVPRQPKPVPCVQVRAGGSR